MFIDYSELRDLEWEIAIESLRPKELELLRKYIRNETIPFLFALDNNVSALKDLNFVVRVDDHNYTLTDEFKAYLENDSASAFIIRFKNS